MADSVYKVITLVGTSPDSWEKAAANAITMAAKSPSGPPHRRSRRARHADRERQGRQLPREGKGIL